jgi:hypothetical protein
VIIAPRWRRSVIAALIVFELSGVGFVLWNAQPIMREAYRFFDHYLAGDALTGGR